jgi:ferredoxin
MDPASAESRGEMSRSDVGTRLYVKILEDKCCGYSLCAGMSPDVYELDDGGFAFVKEALVPDALEDKARKGARACPERAIVLSEEPFG